jgi:hypothetical protein
LEVSQLGQLLEEGLRWEDSISYRKVNAKFLATVFLKTAMPLAFLALGVMMTSIVIWGECQANGQYLGKDHAE